MGPYLKECRASNPQLYFSNLKILDAFPDKEKPQRVTTY